jgi:Predicted DNA-binding protein with PD1-like DNA-binding motif
MKIFNSQGFGKVYTLRLEPGEDFLDQIELFVTETGLANGVIISGIATFSSCVMHMVTTTGYPPVEYYEKLDNIALELSAISGVIANGIPHIHMVVSNKDTTYAGHCHSGCKVLYLCEVVIAEILEAGFHRVKNECGVYQLVELGRDSITNVPISEA